MLAGKPVPARPKSKSSVLGRRWTRDMAPPPPPRVGTRLPRRSTSRGLNSTFNPNSLVRDPTGRRDTAGRAVPFYPAVRGDVSGPSHQAPASRSHAASPVRENAQKDPFKGVE
jgi:hypothetical protein